MNQGWGHHQNLGFINPGQNQQNQGYNTDQPPPLFSPNQDYVIVSGLNQDLALDVSDDHMTRGKVIIWKKHGMKNQRFRISDQGGKLVLFNFGGGVLGVEGGSSDRGAKIVAKNPQYHQDETWELVKAKKDGNGFEIKSFSGKYLDVQGANPIAGTSVLQWDYHGSKNQIWYIQPL